MKNLLFITAIIITSFFIGNISLAGCICNGNPINYSQTVCNSTPTCAWQADPGSPSGTVSLKNPLGENKTDIPSLLGTVINSVLGIVGSLALVMFIFGGATWMLSGGNQEKVTKGKQILVWATFGMVIIFTAYALVRFVLTTVTGT